jgi:hypothetical protein
MTTTSIAASRLLAAADGVRRRVLVPLARGAPALIVPRDARVGAFGGALVALALVISGCAPAWVLALGPLVWGVPHVLADVRYLVVRPGFHRRPAVAIPVVLGLVLSIAIGVRGAIAGAAAAAVLSRAPVWRKIALSALGAALIAAVSAAGRTSDVVFAHLHNFVAIGFFCAWRRRGTRLWLVPVCAFAVGAALVLGGALDGLAPAVTTRIGTFDLDLARRALAPGLRGVPATRLVLLFAFAQSVHYVVWLALVPAESRSRGAPPSFRQAARALRADLGAWVLALAAVTALVFATWGAIDVDGARSAYLAAASFHGWLEIGAASLFAAEGCWPALAGRR